MKYFMEVIIHEGIHVLEYRFAPWHLEGNKYVGTAKGSTTVPMMATGNLSLLDSEVEEQPRSSCHTSVLGALEGYSFSVYQKHPII
uniref:Uncharacterized protein n=1 Tax=Acrobeloides nanus TaxID=290746 RepID=A0A914C434_9BILA